MNKQYIDFVPVRKKQVVEKRKPERLFPEEEKPLVNGADTFSLRQKVNYGVVEDLRPKFVKTEVPKRPLSSSTAIKKDSPVVKEDEVKNAKGKVVKAKLSEKLGKKTAEKPVSTTKTATKKAAAKEIPKAQFINQEKVKKRPLSKNVYKKEVKTPVEEPKGPVTIITKPEKDAHVGAIITIVLTIILGAAAGTVAFLLLPK